jgi:hypothetical protein
MVGRLMKIFNKTAKSVLSMIPPTWLVLHTGSDGIRFGAMAYFSLFSVHLMLAQFKPIKCPRISTQDTSKAAMSILYNVYDYVQRVQVPWVRVISAICSFTFGIKKKSAGDKVK